LEEETYLPFFFDVVVYDGVESEELKRHIDTKGKVLVDRGMSERARAKQHSFIYGLIRSQNFLNFLQLFV
jgi:hypothetical protein